MRPELPRQSTRSSRMDPNRLVSASLLIFTLALLSHPVQCLSRSTLSDEASPLRFEVTEAPDQSEELELEILPDFGEIVQAYNEKEKSSKNETGKTEDNSWRIDKSFAERLEHMRNISKLTDCLFIVGDGGNTTKFEAHKLVLMAASPVFEAVFENSTSVRVRGWTSEEFSALLNFIYSGDLCIENFEVACTLLYHANSLQLNGVTDTARGFIFNHMYPDHLWKAYHCAKNAADQDLLEAAKELISEHTSQTFKDRAFNDLSQDDLASLLARDDLNVKSEVEVFEAVTRWGLMRVLKEGKTPSPELIREKIGPAVLKQIRFLTMTGIEFSRVHTSAQLLTYEEGLAILLNINNPGVLEMPKSLSSLTQGRKIRATTRTFKTFGVNTNTCKSNSLNTTDIFDLYTTTVIPNEHEGWNLAGIQIPKSLEARKDCTVVERFDVLILNGKNEAVEKFSYDDVTSCDLVQGFKADSAQSYNMQIYHDSTDLMNVIFSPTVKIPPVSGSNKFKIKVVHKGKNTYPLYVDAGNAMKEEKRAAGAAEYLMYPYDFTFHSYNYGSRYRLLYNPNFVYAIVTV
ncbi:uncharacterized protein LOC135936911 [Cloeon dipterum]|uniref:uncharacterized protein LOC135936911 n=1 Tax=Cloeon dipterum TaxID=197152 RepID=UPI0032205FAB